MQIDVGGWIERYHDFSWGINIINGGDYEGFTAISSGRFYRASIPIISPEDGVGVTFDQQEGQGSVLRNFIIKDANTAINITDSSPTVENLTIIDNDQGIIVSGNSSPVIRNCILWNNGDDSGWRRRRHTVKEKGELSQSP